MKKFVLYALSVFVLFSLVSCGSKTKPDSEKLDAPSVVTKPEEVLDNATVIKTIESARELAIKAGAEEKASEQLALLDQKLEDVKAKAESGSEIQKEGKDLADRYLALSGYLSAKDAKEKIDSTEKHALAQALYDDGCAALSELEALYQDPNATGEELLSKATTASTCLNSALITVYKKVASDERQAAMLSKKNADSVKAGVAMKQEYNQAVNTFKKGDSLYSIQNPVGAYESYKEANLAFENLFQVVQEKREAALKAIEDAKKAVKETETFAETADTQAPITEPMEGIEEEGTVLLEEETYADPTEAEAELPENPEDPVKEAVESTVDQIMEDLSSGDAK